jgi:hypothetical protein
LVMSHLREGNRGTATRFAFVETGWQSRISPRRRSTDAAARKR